MKILTTAIIMLALCSPAADMNDFDQDGLPDLWESRFGLSTNRSTGIDGAAGDPDCDGLSNYAEYRGGKTIIGANVYSNYTWAVTGLSPTNATSVTAGILDCFHKPVGSEVTLRWMLTDHDFLDDSWEATNSVTSPKVFDADIRVGKSDAWSLNRAKGVRPKVLANVSYWGTSHKDSTALVRMHFYTASAMDGTPDAIATISGFNAREQNMYVASNVVGRVVTGRNYIFCFLDLDSDGAFDAGEPAGVSSEGGLFGTEIGHSGGIVSVQLTDYTQGYPRVTWFPAAMSESKYEAGWVGNVTRTAFPNERVRVRRTYVDGLDNVQSIALDKVLHQRNYIHEGDFLAQGDLGLDWNFDNVDVSTRIDMAVYEVYVGNAVALTNNTLALTFTNRFDSARPVPTQVSPINGAYVYASRPVFRWTMPEGYTAFALEITNGIAVYQTGELQIPARDIETGEFVWEANIHAGNRLSNGMTLSTNTTYRWRVMALNAKFDMSRGVSRSDWKSFRIDLDDSVYSSGYGKIPVLVKYVGAGEALTNKVVVQAFRNPSFVGVPEAQYTLADAALTSMISLSSPATNAFLIGLSPSLSAGDYYVRAFIDSNANGVRDVWESWGYANNLGGVVSPYDARPVTVSGKSSTPTVTLVVEDMDTDQDWFPDVWEYELNPAGDFLGLTGPSPSEVNPTLSTTP